MLPKFIIEDGNTYEVKPADNERQVTLHPHTVTVNGKPGQSLLIFTTLGCQPPAARSVGIRALQERLKDGRVTATIQ